MDGSRCMKMQVMGCHAATPRFLTYPSGQVVQAGTDLSTDIGNNSRKMFAADMVPKGKFSDPAKPVNS